MSRGHDRERRRRDDFRDGFALGIVAGIGLCLILFWMMDQFGVL